MTVYYIQIPGRIYLFQIRHHVLDRGDLDAEPVAEPETRVPPHHAIVSGNLCDAFNNLAFLNQLTDYTGGRAAGQPAQINGGFSVASSLTHTAGASAQGQDMAGAAEVVRFYGRVGQALTCQGAVVRGYPCCHGGVVGVDGDCVGGDERVGVVGHHLGELQFVGVRWQDGCADVATGVSLVGVVFTAEDVYTSSIAPETPSELL